MSGDLEIMEICIPISVSVPSPPLSSLFLFSTTVPTISSTTTRYPVTIAKQASAPHVAFHLETHFAFPQPSQKPFEGRIITYFLTGAQRIPFAQSHTTFKW